MNAINGFRPWKISLNLLGPILAKYTTHREHVACGIGKLRFVAPALRGTGAAEPQQTQRKQLSRSASASRIGFVIGSPHAQ